MNAKSPRDDDPYARESFTFRRMTKPQLWLITIVVVVVVIAALMYAAG